MTSGEAASIRPASLADLDELMTLVPQFYETFGYPCEPARKREALRRLLEEPSLGRVFVAEAGGHAGGYLILAFSYSLEHDGPIAFVDELYIEPARRGSGLGRAALQRAAEVCRGLGIQALRLETERDNATALRLYAGSGFVECGRELLTLRLG